MPVDYRKAMGVQSLSRGDGVRIAILDSGVPPPNTVALCGREKWLSDLFSESPDEFGHATAVSSILFGGSSITGICDRSVPVFIKVLDSKGRGSVSDVVKGMYDAIDAGADIINLSLGFVRTEKCPKSLENACWDVYDAGKTVICASGNDGGLVNWPAALKTTICVGATDQNGIKSSFSSTGEVDFVAPGVNLPVLGLDGREKRVSGTSFATSLVTGVAALLISRTKSLGMAYSGMEQVKRALRRISYDVDSPGWDENTGYGLIDGRNLDTVNLKISCGIFGTILERIRSLFKRRS